MPAGKAAQARKLPQVLVETMTQLRTNEQKGKIRTQGSIELQDMGAGGGAALE